MSGHSPLGGSGAYRWIACPGSVRLSSGVDDPESDYAAEGTAAHSLAETCLREGSDAWQHVGDGVSKEMADAVQVYLDAVRQAHPQRDQGNTWIERAFKCGEVHPLMYGRIDFCHWEARTEGTAGPYISRLHVWDYKHGAGVVVEVQRNPQLMYYGVGMLTELQLWPHVSEVVLHVAQPRGFHSSGPIREWAVPVQELAQWRDDVLVPAMDLAADVASNGYSGEELLMLGLLKSGEHCRFCPARRPVNEFCPRLAADAKEMEDLMAEIEAAGGAAKAHSDKIGRFLTLFEGAKVLQKAAREVGFMRAQEGHVVPGWKLARARANREWKEDAQAKAVEVFGKDALTAPELKSPAQVDALPGGKKFTAEYAFKPDAGMQLVPDTDARPEAGPRGRAMFEPVKRERARA